MKQKVIAMEMQPGRVKLNGESYPLSLPKGCEGIFLCFESKKTAREYFGKNVPMVELEFEKKEQLWREQW